MITYNEIVPNLRKLAKKSYYQTLFSACKELHGIRLFKNEFDLTYYQIIFIRFLNFYQSINLDIALHEVEEEVLDNEIFEDSYMFYKQNKKEDGNKNIPKNMKKNEVPVGGFNWVFKRGE